MSAAELVDSYLAGVKNRLLQLQAEGKLEIASGDIEAALKDFSLTSGATEADLTKLKATYPTCPETLIELLRKIDGTYWRKYQSKEIALLILGSDVDEGTYPYYLLSAAQILESAQERYWSIREFYGDDDFLNEVECDARIDLNLPISERLHFSDCMNNGGTSQLFIDFNPKGEGKVGQIVRYLHDPDSYAAIADSFEDYLRMLMAYEYSFIQAD